MQSSNLDLNEDLQPPICRNSSNEKMIPESVASSSDTEDDLKIDSLKSDSLKIWFEKIAQMQNEIQKKLQLESMSAASSKVPPPASPKMSRYQDLPYMGEMTLDNSKPRRGRKPKKADICHLIYKNYGTIFPGTPTNSLPHQSSSSSVIPKSPALPDSKLFEANERRSNVQNRIISSLLERRLTQQQENKRLKKKEATVTQQSEPLNLCVRDLDHLNLRLTDVKVELQSDASEDTETLSPSSLQDFSPSIFSPQDLIKTPTENGTVPGGYVYWPNAGVFIHQAALQQQLLHYQKMTQNQTHESVDLISNNNNNNNNNNNSNEKTKETGEKVSKRISSATERNEKSSTNKRKRSAIFIPPIPAENQNNPATEVSICKFKFTGGAKPSLQEKKMLSVDSGGNFRYYSGTGDKSMRGYEFFPRETLQQQIHNTQGSSTGAFLQASGEKIFPASPMAMDFTAINGEPEIALQQQQQTAAAIVSPEQRNKKRKSRKSLQREKLEQTFKEKGFLIQTQQLESAEGATYCKFRQLRKFTRYLFRSWKDYLPGNVGDNENLDDKRDMEEISEDLSLRNLSSPRLASMILDESPHA